MSQPPESSPTRRTSWFRRLVSEPVSGPRRLRRWIVLITVLVVAALLLTEALISASYDGIAALLGVLLGSLAGRLASAWEWLYSDTRHFWMVAGPAMALWLVGAIAGAYAFYPMWIFGFWFFFPVVFAGSLLVNGLLRFSSATP